MSAADRVRPSRSQVRCSKKQAKKQIEISKESRIASRDRPAAYSGRQKLPSLNTRIGAASRRATQARLIVAGVAAAAAIAAMKSFKENRSTAKEPARRQSRPAIRPQDKATRGPWL